MSEHILKTEDLRKRSDDELTQQLGELKQELFNLRFQHHTGQLENFMKIPKVKKNIARIHTILRERQLATAE
ncbi:MAG TPA: 50S ribosomal protein L29 [Myxococcales bacterium]|nr:50S ribosomal protein L29 [Deltaproteobacteria bacterium]MBU48337.1 50S ribosomal protein L29 [Deltaproteobacteria bacterium]HAA56970.1 50S ribosomal protein L29 [Myxococcales bacterium]|tara:strand:+ start:50260 stop:50475 length:216 start_codon:yes stop_codon:yes gene_type:complete